ncbi:LPO_1073/Vpar_1526 family protein [Capnocytophaga sp. G1920]|uniref:LPO_1073/Vpar_1526 family protein n=1 Tax=Capnocytophaga sp. G1920 TaxID=3448875 RepID=UPI003EDC40D3
MGNKQVQEAGDNSQQFQANNMTVNLGIDEKRAREICQEMILQLKNKYTEEALKVAESRVSEFEDKLLPKMKAIDGALEAFADPSFQLLLVEAQKTAASTERPADYDLLSELLVHRFQNGTDRNTRAGITRAVKIVDEISDEALLGLTVFHAVTCIEPVTGVIEEGLDILNDLFGKLIYATLPNGNKWLDHLDILSTIRVINFVRLPKMEDHYSEQFAGYMDVGIKKYSQEFYRAIELLNSNNLPNILIEHELNTDYVRLCVLNKNDIDPTKLTHLSSNNTVISLTDIQKNAIRSIYDLYKQDVAIRQENVNKFMKEWNKRTNLKILREWWNNIEYLMQLTSVGKVLAHANAQRCDKRLSPLNH